MSVESVKERVQALAPSLGEVAFAAHEEAPLEVSVTPDGRVGRRSLGGVEWVHTIDLDERAALLAWAAPQPGAFSVRGQDGVWLNGYHDPRGPADGGLLRVLQPGTASHLAHALSAVIDEKLLQYLRALLSIGENLWIVGQSGFESEFAAALCPANAIAVVRPGLWRPPLRGIAMLPPETGLSEAAAACQTAGFSTLIFEGPLDPEVFTLSAQERGIVIVHRAPSPERALLASGLATRPEAATALLALGAVVTLAATPTGGVKVTQIAEFRSESEAEGVAFVNLAETGLTPEPERLTPLRVTRRERQLLGMALGECLDTFPRDDQDDMPAATRSDWAPQPGVDVWELSAEPTASGLSEPATDRGASVSSSASAGPHAYGDTAFDRDPGWELDALAAKGGATPARRRGAPPPSAARRFSDELVPAPGTRLNDGVFRARPVVRPSAPGHDASSDAGDESMGKLALDAPSRKVMIPEAPSSARAKRTFAEILRERHRFPPLSDNGAPTLTPPVLSPSPDADDDDIAP